MLTSTCVQGDLTVFTPTPNQPWDQIRIQHLYRRLGYGASPEMIESAMQLDPATVVDQIIDEAITLPNLPRPEWADWKGSDFKNQDEMFQKLYEYLIDWAGAIPQRGLREKLTVFWSGHFVTHFESYSCAIMAYRYIEILTQYALGNFKDLTVDIGKTPAMLIYLNGIDSTKESPNENYARELFELFTLGRDNGYTQQDIVETSKALTGWSIEYDQATAREGDWCTRNEQFYAFNHDDGVKTIFGKTGNWDYFDVHEILFSERPQEIAEYICGLLYQEFVHHQIDEGIVSQLATTFLDNNFEIAPVLRQLCKSQHFFDNAVIQTQIKGPYQFLGNLVRELDLPIDETLANYMYAVPELLGQALLAPPDVAGWPGHRSWINTTTLTNRWDVVEGLAGYFAEIYPSHLVNFAKKVSGNSTDSAAVTQAIIDYFIPRGLQNPDAYERATKVFQGEIPENYFTNGYWTLDFEHVNYQVFFLLKHIGRLPEFQLY